MAEEKTDVKVDPSTTTETTVTEEQVVDTVVDEQSQVDASSNSQEVKQEGQLQPDGRPEINYSMEALRKVNELSEKIEKLSQVNQTQTQTPQQPQYSEAELTAFLSKPDLDDSTRLSVARELEKVRQRKYEEGQRQIIESLRTQTQSEVTRKQSYDFVSQNFPDTVLRDAAGNILGWDERSPMTRQIGHYLNTNKELRDNPNGLMVAAKMAAFDLGITINPKMQNKLNQTTAQLRKEQKKNLISGGTSVTVPKESSNQTKYNKLMDEYRRTGKSSLLGEIMKLKGQFTPAPTEE